MKNCYPISFVRETILHMGKDGETILRVETDGVKILHEGKDGETILHMGKDVVTILRVGKDGETILHIWCTYHDIYRAYNSVQHY